MLHVLIAVLLLVVVAPVWIVAHYSTRWRTARMLSREQERGMRDLLELARGMERRVESLEVILDSEAPGWRVRAKERVDPWKEEARP